MFFDNASEETKSTTAFLSFMASIASYTIGFVELSHNGDNKAGLAIAGTFIGIGTLALIVSGLTSAGTSNSGENARLLGQDGP